VEFYESVLAIYRTRPPGTDDAPSHYELRRMLASLVENENDAFWADRMAENLDINADGLEKFIEFCDLEEERSVVIFLSQLHAKVGSAVERACPRDNTPPR
jgi:hypothetical protein